MYFSVHADSELLADDAEPSENGIIRGAPPIIILHHPQLGENIGMTARAMLNCGARHLRLVSPRDGWPNTNAEAASAGALPFLTVEVFETLEEAVADISLLVATTAQTRAQVKPVWDVPHTAQQVIAHKQGGGKAAILFGAERCGLGNEEISLSHALLTIPLNPDFSSLNLAQAVLLVLYQWRLCMLGEKPAFQEQGKGEPARMDTLLAWLGRLELALENSGFFLPPEKKPAMRRNLQNIFLRNNLTEQEVQTLHGVLTALLKH